MKWYLLKLLGLNIFSLLIVFTGIGQNGSLVSTTADSSTVLKQLAVIKKSTTYELSVISLKKMLTLPGLTADESLAIQSSLVHQYQELQQWDTCLNYCQQQITLAHQQKNNLAAATFYKLLGNTYYFIPDKDKAVLYWEKSIAVSGPNQYNILLEQCYHNVGAVYLEKGEHFDWAEKYFLKALQLGLQHYPATAFENTQHYRLLASLYANTNQFKKAEELYLDVIEKSKALKDTAHLSETLTFYSELLIKKKEFDKGIQISAQALALSRNLRRLDLTYTALEFHARNLFAAGRYKEACEFKEELDVAGKERFKIDLNAKISEAEAKFKTTEVEHEKQIAAVKAKKEKQLYILAFVSLLGIAGSMFYYFYQKRNVKQKQQMQLQVQQEKERLSRDLHDNLGSQMALLSNNIESLDNNFKKQQQIEENIEKVKGTSKQLLQTLRETIWILHKEQVTAQEFFDKLIDYTQRYLQSCPGIQLQVKEIFSFPQNLNSTEALQLFRICQEAISNASKYSESKSLLLQGNAQQTFFEISIRDFGKGFDINKINEEGHYGLKNMQQRAAAVNATFTITAAAGKGVAITIKIANALQRV